MLPTWHEELLTILAYEVPLLIPMLKQTWLWADEGEEHGHHDEANKAAENNGAHEKLEEGAHDVAFAASENDDAAER
jgi:hypothetical protein